MTATRASRPASRPQWGRVHRGVVWHVVPTAHRDLGAGASTWCGKTAPHADLLDGLVPDNARVCPDCCAAVAEFARSISQTATESERIHSVWADNAPVYVEEPETYRGRAIDDVDLLGQLADDEGGDR